MKKRANRARPRHRTLGLESLESRVVLDGSVRAFVSGGNLRVLGDSRDNQILITQPSARSFTISSRDGSTLINGQTAPQTFSKVRKNVEISMERGNDIVEIAGTAGDAVKVSRRLIVNTGSGNDQVLLTVVHAIGLHINTGSGDDTVRLNNDGTAGAVIVTKEAIIVTGSGQDDAAISNSIFKRFLNLSMGNNNDETTLQNVQVRKRSVIHGSSGFDTLNRAGNSGKLKFLSYEDVNNTVQSPAPLPPVAANDSATVARSGNTTINVAANDSSATSTLDLTSIAIVQGQGPTNGTVVVNTNGTVTYTNNGAAAATDSFQYTIKDASGTTSNAATVSITVTADVNNAPVRTGGNPQAINVQEDSANATAVSLGLSGLTYGPGGSGEEASQTLTFQVTAIPAFINVFKADGTTAVAATNTLTLAELQGLTYKTVVNATGTGNFTWTVKDNGGTANGGVDTLTETLAITVNAVNDAPLRTAGAPAAINVAEDSANTTAETLGLSGLTYGPGGGSDEASQTLTFKLTAIPAFISVFKADGTTAVAANDTLTLAELQGLTCKTVANANGTGNLTWSVQDSGGTASGGVDTLNETLAVTVNAINDAPVRTAGNPPVISVNEDSDNATAVTLGLSGLTYGPGGGGDEASQTLTFKVTAIPAFINVFKADGTTAVAANDTLTLAELQGLTYKTVANATGSGNLTWSVQDSGGTAGGGVDTLTETLAITVNAINDAPVRTSGNPPAISVDEDSANTTAVTLGLSGLTYGPGGGSDEASQTLTFKLTAIPAFINVFKADGTTAVAVNDTLTLAELRGLTYETVANANGTGNLTWSVQDSGGTAGGGVDTLNETLAVSVNAINDAPSFTISGDPPAVTESTSEQAQSVSNFATNISAGPSDEAAQTLTFILTVIGGTGGLTFATQPAIDTSGTLTYTPSADSSGTATVQVVLADNGSGTAPNVNQSAPQTFTITVNPSG